MISASSIFYALLGGILPALIWLIFWQHEDRRNPEPRGYIIRTFLLGMLAVVLVLPFQRAVDNFFPGMGIMAIALWAILEEGFKFIAGYFGGIHTTEDNEPVDPIIYMITASLGFVALENTLFIIGPLIDGDFVATIVTGNLRFIGASLLHVVSSAMIGLALAFTFYKSRVKRIFAGLLAFTLAVVFHSLFNLFLINGDKFGAPIAFGSVWAAVMILLLLFEKAKTIAP